MKKYLQKQFSAFFYKAGLLVAIFSVVAMIFTLCGIAYIHEKQPEKLISVLSDSHVILYNSSEEEMSIQEYKDSAMALLEKFSIGVNMSDGFTRGIYSTDDTLNELSIEQGRIFSEDDYNKRKDVVMLRSDMKTICSNVNGVLYYHYGGNDYEVVGTYYDKTRNSVTSPKCIISLCAKSIADNTEWTIGFFDAGENSIELLSKTDLLTEKGMSGYLFGVDEGDVFSNVYSNNLMMILLYALVAVMVFLNVFTATNNWLKGKRKEIVVRKMVGATNNQIIGFIVSNFMMLVAISFLVGLFWVKMILVVINTWDISPSMVMMFGDQIYWHGVIIGLGIVLTIGFVTISVRMFRYLRKEVIQVIRGE